VSNGKPDSGPLSEGIRRIGITLPTELVDLLECDGRDFITMVADAVREGLKGIPAEPQGPANHPDPEVRRRQVADALRHYAGRYWLLSLQIPMLTAEVDELRKELEALETANAE
jgi:hypothetical protein